MNEKVQTQIVVKTALQEKFEVKRDSQKTIKGILSLKLLEKQLTCESKLTAKKALKNKGSK